MESSLVGGLVAQVEGETFFVYGAVVGEAIGLQQPGAVAQPVVLGHALDQNHFGAARGAVLAFEVDDELVIFACVLPRQEDEHAAPIREAWLMWFFEDASLPSSVFGPVESWALA